MSKPATPNPTPTYEPSCECGHIREQHTQGCRMTGCDCPYFAPPADPPATPKGDGCKVSGCLNRVVLEVSDGPHGLSPRTNIYRACEEHKGQIDVFGFENVQRFSSGSHTSDGVSGAVPRTLTAPEAEIEQQGYELGWRAGRDAAAAANLKQVSHVVELGPETLRAVVEPIVLAILELQYTQHPRQCRPATADDLLAHLKETK